MSTSEQTCIRMYCESEGRCHGIVLVYFSQEQKRRILSKIDDLSSRYKVVPDVTLRNMDQYGEVIIEFYDEYHHEDACFFEDLVKALGAKLCDCEEI